MQWTPSIRAARHLNTLLFLLISASTSAPAQEPVRIACVGDSITEGNANPDFRTNSWPQILGRLLETHAPGTYLTGNFGRSGATLLHTGRKPYRDQDVYAAGLAFRPDWVLINLGTNDATEASWSGDVSDFERDLRALISDYQGLKSQPRILLSNLTPIYAPFPKEAEYVQRRIEVETVIDRLTAELDLAFVDLKAPLQGKPELFPDGLHPNTAGSERMAAAVFERLVGVKPPHDTSLRPRALASEGSNVVHLVRDGQAEAVRLSEWTTEKSGLEGSGKNASLASTFGTGPGDFHLRAKLRMLGQKGSAAGFALGNDFFGFEGVSETIFRNGPHMLGLKLLHPAGLLWQRDAWIDFEVIRNNGIVWFVIDGFTCEMAPIAGPIERFAFEPMRSRMQIAEWSLVGDLVPLRPRNLDVRSKNLPWVDAARGTAPEATTRWYTLTPDDARRGIPSAPIIVRSDGTGFLLKGVDPAAGADAPPTSTELQLIGPDNWMMKEPSVLGHWDAFPGVLASHIACTPLRQSTPLLALVEDRRGSSNTLALSSEDEGRSWSKPFELPAAVTGHGHYAMDLPDGRLGLVFIDRHAKSPTRDDLVLWVGTHADLLAGREGQWTARLLPGPPQMSTGLEVVDLHALPHGEFRVELVRSKGVERQIRTLTFRIDDLEAKLPTRSFDIPTVDLDQDEGRHVVVDREAGQYLGHVTTSLLPDGKTILAVYPKGHGRGPIVYKRSPDGGQTWSERLPTPASWETSLEVPTIHRLTDPRDGTERLILWSGLFPARRAYSEDNGATWSELEKVGDWGGIVVMGFVERLNDGSYLAMFHDDGRFFRKVGRSANPVVFTLFQTRSHDGGLTWSEPETVWSGSDLHLCEPGAIRSPDGKTLAVLLRENTRTRNSHVIFSTDEAQTWSAPRELPAALTGDRHTAKYGPDGRLFVSFRDTAQISPTQGDWVGWVGTFDDILEGRPGQYRVRIKDNRHKWDTTYPGVEVLPDGTFVVTTYGHWETNEEPFILSTRFNLNELDERAALETK